MPMILKMVFFNDILSTMTEFKTEIFPRGIGTGIKFVISELEVETQNDTPCTFLVQT